MKTFKSWHLAVLVAASAAFFPSAHAMDAVSVDNATNVKRVTGWDWVSPSRSTDPQGPDQIPKDVAVFVMDSGLAVHVYKWGSMYHPYGGFALTRSWASSTYPDMTAPNMNGQVPDTTGYDLATHPDYNPVLNYFGFATPWFGAHTDYYDWHSFPYTEWAFQAGSSVLHRYSSWSVVDVLVSARGKIATNSTDFTHSRSWRVLAKSDGSAAVDLAVGDFVSEANGTLTVTRHETNVVGASVLTIYSVSGDLSFTKVDQFLSPSGFEDPVSAPLWITTENWTPGSPQPTFYYAGASGGSYIMLPFYDGAPLLYRQDTGEAWKSGFVWRFDSFSLSMGSYMSQFFGVEVSTNTLWWTVTPHLAGLVPVSVIDLKATNVYFVAFQDPVSLSWALQSRSLNSAWYFSGETAPLIPSQPDFDNPLVYLPRADSTYAVLDINCAIPGYESCQYDSNSAKDVCSTGSGTFWRSSTNAERQCKRYVTLASYYPTGTPTWTWSTPTGQTIPYSDYDPITDFAGAVPNQNAGYWRHCIYLNPDKTLYKKPLQFCRLDDIDPWVSENDWNRFCWHKASTDSAFDPNRKGRMYFHGKIWELSWKTTVNGRVDVMVDAAVCSSSDYSTGIVDTNISYGAYGAGNDQISKLFPTLLKVSDYVSSGTNSGSYHNSLLGLRNTYSRFPKTFDNAKLREWFGWNGTPENSSWTIDVNEDLIDFAYSEPSYRNPNDPNDPKTGFYYYRVWGDKPLSDPGTFYSTVWPIGMDYYSSWSTLSPLDPAYYDPQARPPGQSLTGGTVFGVPQYTQPWRGYKGMFNCDANHDGTTGISEWFNCGSTLSDNFTWEFDGATSNFRDGISSASDLGNAPKSVDWSVFGPQEHSSNPLLEGLISMNEKWNSDNKFVRFMRFVTYMALLGFLCVVLIIVYSKKSL